MGRMESRCSEAKDGFAVEGSLAVGNQQLTFIQGMWKDCSDCL